jgi:hypothetical protein
MCPPPVPLDELRKVWPAGVAHVVTELDRADQYDTTHAPLDVTVLAGVLKLDVAELPVRFTALAIGPDALVPEYASKCSVPLTVPVPNVTVTLLPASPEPATRCHTDVYIVAEVAVPTRVQPDGPVWAVLTALVATRISPLPAVTPVGTVTDSVAALALVDACPTKATGLVVALGCTVCVVEADVPAAFVTVSVTV